MVLPPWQAASSSGFKFYFKISIFIHLWIFCCWFCHPDKLPALQVSESTKSTNSPKNQFDLDPFSCEYDCSVCHHIIASLCLFAKSLIGVTGHTHEEHHFSTLSFANHYLPHNHTLIECNMETHNCNINYMNIYPDARLLATLRGREYPACQNVSSERQFYPTWKFYKKK